MQKSTNSSLNYINDSLIETDPEYFRKTTFIFGIVLTFFFCVIGSLGNVVAMMVTLKMMYQRHLHPLFAIFTALILSDTLVLLLTLITNVMCVGYPYTGIKWTIPLFLNHGPIIIVLWPILLACQMSSTYLTVLVSYERYIAVCKPFSSNRCSFKRVCRWIIITNVLSILYNSPRWWEYTVITIPISNEDADLIPVSYLCSPDNLLELNLRGAYYKDYVTAINNICNATTRAYDKSVLGSHKLYRYIYGAGLYALFVFLIPVSLLTYWNVALINRLKNSRRLWRHMSRSQRKELKLTTIPLTIVVLFYILGLPAVLINFIDSLTESINSEIPIISIDAWQALLTLSNFLIILNSSVNFIIYCFAGRKFRQTLFLMCCYTCRAKCRSHITVISDNNPELTNATPNDRNQISLNSQ